MVEIYIDGACSGNPGPGGWGVVMRWNGRERELSGGERSTTNNRMELTAAIKALETMKRELPVEMFSDSQYLVRGMTEWLPAWRSQGWLNARKRPVKNDDLWRRLDELNGRFEVKWHWVRGHAGDPLNERADRLATEAVPSP